MQLPELKRLHHHLRIKLLNIQFIVFHLTGHDAHRRLAGNRIHLQEVGDAVGFGEDEVHPHYAVAVKVAEDAGGVVAHEGGLVVVDDGGRDEFVAHGGVFGVVVVEFVGGHHLGDSQHLHLAIYGGHAAGELAPTHELLHYQLVVVFEGLRERACQLLTVVHFRHADAGARVAGLHEARVAAHRFDALEVYRVVHVEMQRRRDGDAQVGHRQIAVVFVERQGGAEDAAAGVGQSHQLEIGLQPPVLAGRAMDGDEGRIEGHLPVGEGQREVVLVHLPHAPVGIGVVPVRPFEMDQIGVEQVPVQLVEDVVSCLEGYFIFAGIPAGNKSYIIHNNTIISNWAKI